MATSEGLLINNLYWLFIPLASETLKFTHRDLPIEKKCSSLQKNCSHFCKREKKSPTERTFWNQNQINWEQKEYFLPNYFFKKIFQMAVKKIEKKRAESKKTEIDDSRLKSILTLIGFERSFAWKDDTWLISLGAA